METGGADSPRIERRVFVGTAGWSVPRASADRCPGDGTHLQRYSRTFTCAEINSSFHRPHPATTYAKWAGCTPPGFRFAVKLPRTITHDRQLRRARTPFAEFLDQTSGLGDKRGPLLVQLPPSLGFDVRVAGRFFAMVRAAYTGLLVCEPRHETWFSSRAATLLRRFLVARVAADPSPIIGANTPSGWEGAVYFRLHGSPRKYWSKYDAAFIRSLSDDIESAASSAEVWCVFDNTASGAAIENAWELNNRLHVVRTGADVASR